MINFQ
jgi:U4/U6 small nuclear ribonucleoprotein SNU13